MPWVSNWINDEEAKFSAIAINTYIGRDSGSWARRDTGGEHHYICERND